eukprot:g15248.t1
MLLCPIGGTVLLQHRKRPLGPFCLYCSFVPSNKEGLATVVQRMGILDRRDGGQVLIPWSIAHGNISAIGRQQRLRAGPFEITIAEAEEEEESSEPGA